MKSLWLPASILVALYIAACMWVGGVRIVVTQELADPEIVASTLIVAGVPDLRLLESPQGICQEIGGEPQFCAAGAFAGIRETGTILLRLPFSQTLYDMTVEPP